MEMVTYARANYQIYANVSGMKWKIIRSFVGKTKIYWEYSMLLTQYDFRLLGY